MDNTTTYFKCGLIATSIGILALRHSITREKWMMYEYSNWYYDRWSGLELGKVILSRRDGDKPEIQSFKRRLYLEEVFLRSVNKLASIRVRYLFASYFAVKCIEWFMK